MTKALENEIYSSPFLTYFHTYDTDLLHILRHISWTYGTSNVRLYILIMMKLQIKVANVYLVKDTK